MPIGPEPDKAILRIGDVERAHLPGQLRSRPVKRHGGDDAGAGEHAGRAHSATAPV